MSAAKPIDWTRPLRTVVGHNEAHVVGIVPSAPLCVFLEVRPEAADLYKLAVDRRGHDEQGDLAVENLPPEPVILVRFMVVQRTGWPNRPTYAPAPDLPLYGAHDDAGSRTIEDQGHKLLGRQGADRGVRGMNRLRSWSLLGPAVALAGAMLFVIFAPRTSRAETGHPLIVCEERCP